MASSFTPEPPTYPTTPLGLYTGPNWKQGEALWKGIDVSIYQQPERIDWAAAQNDGVVWGMARGSYGSTTDHNAYLHVARMRDGGVKPGLYFFPTEAPVDVMWDIVREQAVQCDIGPGDVAPAYDLEWLDGKGKLPQNRDAYLENVDELLRRTQETFGMAWIYTATGFWQQMGRPKSWLDWDWWEALYRSDPPSDDPVEWAAWQKGTIEPAWSRAGKLDFNLARRLPLVQGSKVGA